VILILGGSGQLGTAMRARIPDALCPSRSQLDLAEIDSIEAQLDLAAPSAIINCAAYTDVDGAEADRETAHLVNADAVGVIARYAARRAIPFVTFSTDYVFDGRSTAPYVETSIPSPINVYGATKLAGEEEALRYGGSLVVRTSWLFSATHDNFVSRVLRRALEGPVRVVDDQFGSPTAADDLAGASTRELAAGTTGLIHLSGTPPVSRYELARAAVRLAGLPPALVEPCSSRAYPTPADRPLWSVLASGRSRSGVDRIRPWTDSLPPVVDAVRDRIAGRG